LGEDAGVGFWESVLTGVGSSIVASIVFLIFLARVRPRLEISSVIAKEPSKTDPTVTVYRIKIVNRSRRPSVDLCVQVFTERRAKAPGGGDVIVLRPLHPQIQSNMLPGRPMRLRNDRDARYARRILLKEDIESRWSDDTDDSVLVRVFARDSLSNFGRQFERRFEYKTSALVEGRFEHGMSTKIIPL
jgi:hypothetical protein